MKLIISPILISLCFKNLHCQLSEMHSNKVNTIFAMQPERLHDFIERRKRRKTTTENNKDIAKLKI